ncbi:MAG: hypothetical protein ACXWLR_02765 [Myxococcales bacterium]
MKALWRAAPWILAAAFVLRLPGLVWRILGIDDSDFTVIARAMTHGAVLYRDVVDIKPPLAFALYLPNAWLDALWPVQVEGILFVAATALLLGAAARRTWGSDAAAVCAAALSIGAGLCEAPTVSTELLMNLPTAAALALYARWEEEERGWAGFACGALLGLAALVRHQAVFTLGALGLAAATVGLRARRPWFSRWILLSLGFVAPWAATMAIFRQAGALPDFVDWVLVRNFRYVGQSAGSTLLRLLQGAAVCVLGAAPLPWMMALRGGAEAVRAPGGLSAAPIRLRLTWLALLIVSIIPVSLGGRFYEHYFLQFVPPLALLGAGPLAELLSRWHALRPGVRAALVALAAVPAIGALTYTTARGLLRDYPLQNPQVQAIGTWLRAHSAPDDRLFVWGHFSPIYLAADRLPGTRYVTTSWHLGNFDPQHIDDRVDLRRFRSDRDVRLTIADLRELRPEWIVDTTPADIHSWRRLPLSLLPDLEAEIARGWREVGRAGGARLLQRRR